MKLASGYLLIPPNLSFIILNDDYLFFLQKYLYKFLIQSTITQFTVNFELESSYYMDYVHRIMD